MNASQVRDILKNVQYLDWVFFVAEKDNGDPDYLQVKFFALCTKRLEEQSLSGRKWKLSSHMTVSEIVTTAFKAVITAIEHEARESFKYKGQPIFGPHIDVEYLASLYARFGDVVLDERKEHNDDNERRCTFPG